MLTNRIYVCHKRFYDRICFDEVNKIIEINNSTILCDRKSQIIDHLYFVLVRKRVENYSTILSNKLYD